MPWRWQSTTVPGPFPNAPSTHQLGSRHSHSWKTSSTPSDWRTSSPAPGSVGADCSAIAAAKSGRPGTPSASSQSSSPSKKLPTCTTVANSMTTSGGFAKVRDPSHSQQNSGRGGRRHRPERAGVGHAGVVVMADRHHHRHRTGAHRGWHHVGVVGFPAGRNVEHDELDALLAVCTADGRPAGAREAPSSPCPTFPAAAGPNSPGLHLGDVDLDPPAIGVVGKGGNTAWCPSPPPLPRSSGLGWRGEVTSRARCSARSTGRQHPSTSVPSLVEPFARFWVGAVWPPGSKPSPRATCAAAMPRTCSTPGADLPTVQQLRGHSPPAIAIRSACCLQW